MLKVLCIFGTRPEVIKMAPVIWALNEHPEHIAVRTCATAQHRELLDQMLDVFDIVPDVDLDLMQAGQTPNQLAARVLAQLDPVLAQVSPDWVLVQGDTTTVLTSAIAAHHRRIRIGHVEAGLRTWDRWNPFPEEMNRVLTDHISDLCFAPTERARQNLLEERIPEAAIRVTGNTVVDALMWVRQQPLSNPAEAVLRKVGLAPTPRPDDPRLILVTAHRRENFGKPLTHICQALREIAQQGAGEVQIVYPVHPNPNVQEVVDTQLEGHPHITLIPPVDYLTLVTLIRRSTLILTDSGGIQEEAPSLGVPVLVLRETTERPEAVEAGVVRVVGTDTAAIVSETHRLLQDPAAHAAMAQAINPYGDGHAAERIVKSLLEEIEKL
jgi:UDP-N-acetylglucosamine 2-epimerase (non-hydrolysing)